MLLAVLLSTRRIAVFAQSGAMVLVCELPATRGQDVVGELRLVPTALKYNLTIGL